MKTLAVLQPGYIPWLGFFDQIMRADVFVLYDDVQFDKHSWRNRNRIKSPQGPFWLTVPVLHTNKGFPSILDIEIDPKVHWARKHIGTLKQFYARAPYTAKYLPELEELLHRPWKKLVDLDLEVLDWLLKIFKIEGNLVRSSSLEVAGGQSDRLVNFCRHFGAGRYLSGDAAKSYLDLNLFLKHDIQVEWQAYNHPVYPQQHGDFVPFLSALDLLFNVGEESGAVLRSARKSERPAT